MTPLLLLLLPPARAELPACDFPSEGAGIYLITVSPSRTVHTVFGHSAILVYDPRRDEESLVYDFGRVDLSESGVVWDVLTATQDYLVGTRELDSSRRKYERQGRGAIAQRLDLAPSQAQGISDELKRIVRFDNEFRYNWYRPNCTTRVADLFDDALQGTLAPQHKGSSGTSPAREVLRHSAHMPHLWFGLHWGSGRLADVDISWWDAMFLPESLMERLRVSTIEGPGSRPRPLVSSECRIMAPVEPEALPEAPNRDLPLAGIGLAAGAAVAGAGAASRRVGVWVVGLLGVALGVFGSAALMVGTLGTFAPFWGHHNLWFSSPLSGLLAVAAWWAVRRPGAGAVRLAGALVFVGVLGVVASAVHGFADRNLGIAALVLPSLFAATWVLARIQRLST